METNCAHCHAKLTVQPEDQCATCQHNFRFHMEANIATERDAYCFARGICDCPEFEPLPAWCSEVCEHRYNNELVADMRGDKVE